MKFLKIVLGHEDGTTTQQDVQVSETVKCVCDVKLVSTSQISETLQDKHIQDPPKPKSKPKPTPKPKPDTNPEREAVLNIAGDESNVIPAK